MVEKRSEYNQQSSRPLLTRRLAYGVVRLYPAAWRERYAIEMLDILSRRPVTLWTVLDVLLGAVDARLHLDLLPERVTSMAHRIRTSEILIFCAFVLFGLGWLTVNTARDPLLPWEVATRLHPELLLVFSIAQAAGGIAFLALVAGGLPILFTVIRRAIAERRWNVLLWLCVPIVAFGLLGVFGVHIYSASVERQSAAPDAPLTATAVTIQFGMLLLFVAALAVSVFAMAHSVTHTNLEVGLVRLLLWPAAVVTLAMVIGLVATIVFTALSYAEATELGPGNLTGSAVVMLIAAVLAAFALRRGIIAARGGDTSTTQV